MIFDPQTITAFLLTIKLASLSTLILLLISTPFAWWLAKTNFKFKFILEAIVALPLVLPPTVLGFYLLVALAPQGPIGSIINTLGLKPFVFNFSGLVFGSLIYSLPFVVQPLQNAFSSISNRNFEVAATLGASPFNRFFTIAIPLAWRGFVSACVLGFAHTLGEFGVVLMIGGNIPGSTKVISIAIYDHVESLDYDQAYLISAALLLFSLLMLIVVYSINRRFTISIRQ